jgi:hypothetical protein
LDWDAQSFYIRLLTVVDDYGRYDADHELLRSFCFPIRSDVTVRAVANMCVQLSEAKLATFYKDDEGKEFLQLTKWQERARSHSKFPGPSDNNCQQVFVTVDKCTPPKPSPSPSPSPSPYDDCESIYRAYPRKVGRPVALRAIRGALKKIDGSELLKRTVAFAAAAADSDPQFIPHPATWFNQERYNDDQSTWRPRNTRADNRENPRNVGVIKGPTDYAAAAARKLQRQQEAGVAGQMDMPQNSPPQAQSP